MNKGSFKNPKAIAYPSVSTVRVGIFTNDIFGWYKDEQSAIKELPNISEALKKINTPFMK